MASNHVAFVTAGGLTNATVAHSLYGVCSTGATTTAKAVTMYKTGKTAGAAGAANDLVDGLTVTVRFTNANTVSSPTLNISSTGAKPIYANGSTSDVTWPAGATMQFTYDTVLNTSGCGILNGSVAEDLKAPLTLQDSSLTIGTAPTANMYPKELIFTDNADQEMGYLQVNNQTNQGAFTIGASLPDDSSQNQIALGYNRSDNTPFTYVSQPTAFRNAISAAASSHNHTASNITSGVLATARGGVPTGGTTGQVLTKTSDTDNAVEGATPSGGGSYGIIKQPENFTVPAIGYPFTFEVITNDPNATYQWQVSEDSGTTGTNSGLAGNKKSKLGPIEASASRLTYQFRCAVTFTGASEPVYTNAVALSLATPTEQSTYYGTCDTAAGTAAKVVTCDGYKLKPGNLISILFTTANTAAAPTLNINSTTAKSVYVGAAVASATNSCKWSANTIVTFIYDGTYYRYLNQVAANTVENGGSSWYGTSSTAADTAAKVVTCANFRLVAGARISVLFSTANTAAVPTLNVNSTGAKAIGINNAVTSATNTLYGDVNELVEFIYDGTRFRHVASAATTAEIDAIINS